MVLMPAFRIACSREVGMLLCLVALQQATIASAEHCSEANDVVRSGGAYTGDDGCYAEVCAAYGCNFACINDNGDGTYSCDSHQGEYTMDDWNSWAKDTACQCSPSSGDGVTICERIPCEADSQGDDSCWSSNDGMCDEQFGICDVNTDCSDCGNCGYDDCDEDCQAALVGVLVVILLFCVVSFIGLGVGIYCCISSKSKTLGSRPTAMAWLGSLLICLFLSPLCMWIPFVIDSCYEPTNRSQNVVITQQQPVIAQAQPMMAHAQAQPMMAQAQAQPMMAVTPAQPMMVQAQAQPMAVAQVQGQPMAVAQAQPMAKVEQGP